MTMTIVKKAKNGRKFVQIEFTETEWGVRYESTDGRMHVLDFEDEEAARQHQGFFGGTMVKRSAYLTPWRVSA